MPKCQTFESGFFFVIDISSADDTDNADYDFYLRNQRYRRMKNKEYKQ